MKRIPGVSAGTILGDGRVALILDAAGLWLGANHAANLEPAPIETSAEPAQKRIMVVDDSITVRKVTSRFLEKHGLEVVTAKDGVEALELLREQLPDVMLVDIEMPRMDGYELTSAVRADANMRHIPIVMITSRAGGKHRERAFELGVNVYLSKPYQEDELLRNVNAMLRGEQLH
jgi:chemosensory pili system protein ChpA (sensor histidine kinase/response regulator)